MDDEASLDVSQAKFPLEIIFGDKKYLLVKSPHDRLMLNAHPDTKREGS
jgi:hypothetical protein